ncbi:MAG: TonB-dependent receptor plug domain-containing protein [Pseudomonadota bacterium]
MFKRNKLNAAVLSVIAASAAANTYAEIDEIIVTATKRPESLQDVSIAVQAVTEETMDQLGVSNFEDYLLQLPGVTAGGSGPGQNTIYIRGIASTTPNLTTAGVAGLAPNVALYLDEQPLAQPGRNLDVYTADMNRVEVLAGPQGTLFGASSQAGTVRLITNKPDHNGFDSNIKIGTATIADGDADTNLELMLNIPLSDALAVRGVFYTDTQGGYIDNVAGTRDTSESARFRPAGTVRSNGVPVSTVRGGIQAGMDLSGVAFQTASNANLVEDDFNETTYNGARLMASWDFSEDWNLMVSHTTQDLEVDGVFFADPDLGDLEIQRFTADRAEDNFDNTNWTFTGRIGALEAIYTGAFTDREGVQLIDYTDYLFVGQYLPYYICDGSVSYPAAAPTGNCNAPFLSVASVTSTEVDSHEFRFATDPSNSFRATFGAFFSELVLTERNDFTYPGTVGIQGFGQVGFSPNFPFTTGYLSDPGPFPSDVVFRNDIQRSDEQTGFFGEATYDLSSQFSVTVGARVYEIEVDMEGSANSSFCNLFQADINAFGTDISDLYNGDGEFTFRGSCTAADHITYTQATVDATTPAAVIGALQAPDKAVADGSIFKVTGTWTPNDNGLFYATLSEGFRPGLLNRPGGASNGAGFTVPFALDTDDITNLELGWKLDLLDYTLRFNGAVFFADVERLQTTIFDTSIVNLFFSDNAADAEVRGLEGDFIWVPANTDGLTISGAFSFLDSEITRVITPTNDVRLGDSLAFAPEFQTTLRARYEWQWGDLIAHVMPHLTHSAESYSDIITINRDRVDGWTMLGVTAGVTADNWSAEFYIDNLTDERAEISRSFVFDRPRVSYARPRTMGVRLSYDF